MDNLGRRDTQVARIVYAHYAAGARTRVAASVTGLDLIVIPEDFLFIILNIGKGCLDLLRRQEEHHSDLG
jgi:hypothetical protein